MDTHDTWSVPLRVVGVTSAQVDVTPRRTQSWDPLPGETVAWSCGSQSGEAVATEDGVKVRDVTLGTTWQTLTLEVIH